MIIESGIIHVKPGAEAKFETVMARGRAALERTPGCRKVEVRRGIETPSHYLLLVWWDSVEDHIAFTKTEGFKVMIDSLGGLVAEPGQVNHYAEPL